MTKQNKLGKAFQRDMEQIARIHLRLEEVERELARAVQVGTLEFAEVSLAVRARVITRILHPELESITIDRPEDYSGPALSEVEPDAPGPTVHPQIHIRILENTMENPQAAGGLENLVLVAAEHQENFSDALHAAIHVLSVIQVQQLWGASVRALSETSARNKQGASALKEANSWFANAAQGRVSKLPDFLQRMLRQAPTHPQW